MSFPEFGKIIEKSPEKAIPGSFPEFGQPIEEPLRFRSLIGAPIKGALEEAADIGELLHKIPLPKGDIRAEDIRKFAEEKFPIQEEKELEKYLKRAGKVGLQTLATGGGALPKLLITLAGAGLGYAAEKLGFPEWAQAIAESAPFFFRGGKKIPLKSSQKKLGDFLRNQGMTEEEITPLLKTPEQINRWSALASKGKKSRELMTSIYNKSGKIYDSIIAEGKNLPPLTEPAKVKLLSEMAKIYEDMPNKYRSLIKKDLEDFLIKGRAGVEDIINLDKDINAVIGAEYGGKAVVGRFRSPLQEAMQSINPEIAENYQLAKDLYRTRANVAGAIVNPKDFDNFMQLGEIYGLGQGIANRDIGMIMKVLGIAGGRKLAREMLINPRLQNISVRVGEALKKNNLALTEKLMNEFRKIIEKDDPELSELIPASNNK